MCVVLCAVMHSGIAGVLCGIYDGLVYLEGGNGVETLPSHAVVNKDGFAKYVVSLVFFLFRQCCVIFL